MSKRTNKKTVNHQPKVVIQPSIAPAGDPLDRETMESVQSFHLRFLEDFLSKFPKFRDVSVPGALTYDLIQIMNNQYLTEHLPK